MQSNHLHLSVQARDALALARGVQALSIRVAKAVNRVLERHGKVFADRSSSVTFARAPRRVPGAGERAFRVRGQITLGSRLLKGRIEGNDGEDPTSCSGLRQRLLRRPRTRVAALALLISARRSDTGSVTLQGTRSSGHAPGHRCARFGPFGTRQLVQPAELRLDPFRCPGAPQNGRSEVSAAQ